MVGNGLNCISSGTSGDHSGNTGSFFARTSAGLVMGIPASNIILIFSTFPCLMYGS